MLALLLACLLPQQPASLAEDPRLSKAPQLAFKVKPLEEVMKSFTEATGVSIQCAGMLREDLVTMYTADRSAGESLDMLAKHFGWTWEPSNNGYILLQTQQARKDEANERDRLYVAELAETREASKKWLADAAKTDKTLISKRLAELDKLWEAAEAKGEEIDRKVWEEYERLSSLSDPYKLLANTTFAELPDSALRQLRLRTRLVLSYYPTVAQSPLPKAAQKQADELVAELAKRVDHAEDEEMPEGMPQPPPRKPVKPEMVATVRVAFTSASGMMGSSPAACSISVVGKDGTILDQGYSPLGEGGPFTGFFGTRPQAAKTYVSEEFQARVTPNDALRAELDWKPTGEADSFARNLGRFLEIGGDDPLLPRAHLVVELARSQNFPLIADAYDDAFAFFGPFMPVGKTVGELLSTTLDPNSTAKFQSGWLTVRADKWQLSRAATTPRSILLTTRDTSLKAGLNIDAMASLASRISEEQARTWPMMLAAGMQMMDGALSEPAPICMLRVWHNLSVLQKHRLINGNAISLDTLSPEARTWLNEYLFRLGDSEGGGGSSMFADPFDEGPPAMPDDSEGVNEEVRMPDTEITQVLPRGPIPGASMTLSTQGKYGVCVKVMLGTMPLTVSLPPYAMAEIEREDVTGVKLVGVKPSNMQLFSFSIECAPGISRNFDIVTATMDPSVPFGKVSDLPEALKSAIATAKERYKKIREAAPPPPPPGRTP